HAIAPDSPGHGVDFDWKALESLRALNSFGDAMPARPILLLIIPLQPSHP
ncbi:MAG: hypothetical protein HW381_1273, partial [Candidatus Rokubacteria bacterium]|nr:hypothetical protein [Candidatus Rokubacteria bacterium]